MADIFENGIGDWFISDEQKKLNESALKDAEIQRQMQQKLIDSMGSKKAMYSGDSASDQKTYFIIGGMAVVMVFAIIMTT